MDGFILNGTLRNNGFQFVFLGFGLGIKLFEAFLFGSLPPVFNEHAYADIDNVRHEYPHDDNKENDDSPQITLHLCHPPLLLPAVFCMKNRKPRS